MSRQVKLGQVKVWADQVRSMPDQVMSGQVKSRCDQVGLSHVR